MKPLHFALLLLTLCGATTLAAQNAANPGDLVPRTGTLAYITSDRPDMVYRLFGKDDQGRWKLRSFAETKWEEEFEDDPESEEARGARTILDYVFDSYEAVARIELAIIDVTADGPKYLLHFKTKEGESIDIEPEFLTNQLEPKEKEFLNIRYLMYDTSPDEDKGSARPAFGEGMQRFYVASTMEGVLISNFETTMRGAIEKLSSGDYSESLSGRDEFKTWQENRTPHDLSIFMIGREIQNAIERLLPSEDQAGVDAESIYQGVDEWIQFREYRYIVFDLDYDEVARGLTVSASFKTRRPTKLLKQLAIKPADFKLLKYLPEGTVMTAGLQLGDAKSTFENLKQLAYDVEGWAKEFEEGMKPPSGMPESMPEGRDGDDGGSEPKTIDPRDILKKLRDAQDAEAEEESRVDRGLGEFEKMLGEYGTSLDEVLGALGTEVLLFSKPDVEAARRNAYGSADFGDVLETGNVGVIVALKDVDKARSIIDTAREKDPEGAFDDFEEVGYQGQILHVSSENPFGYCFTDDALLISVVTSPGEEMTDSVVAGLRGMIDASTRTGTGGDAFIKNGSKFLEFDIGAMTRIQNQLNDDLSKRLDRYAEPPLSKSPTSVATDLTLAMRTKESEDGVEFSIRVAGLPDFGQFLDGEVAIMGARSGRNPYSYSQDNLRTLGTALRERVDSGEAVDLDAMLKGEEIRAGVLQVPLDSRWEGDIEDLGWTTLDQIERDAEGNLPGWVDEDAAKMIEANEQAGFRSIKLADGELAEWIANYKSGFIVAYQEKAETLGGHVVLYADGEVGWLYRDALVEALKLNAEDEPVPADDPWEESGGAEPPPGDGDSGGEDSEGENRPADDDPWVPGND